MSILNNTTKLQSLMDKINALPEYKEGIELPELSNEGSSADLLNNKQLIDGEGNIITGSMPNNGNINATFDGINVKSYTIPKGYTDGGIISLDNTIDNEVSAQTTQITSNADLIDQIKSALKDKTAVSGGTSAYTLSGTWMFNEILNKQEFITSSIEIEFISNAQNVHKLDIAISSSGTAVSLTYNYEDGSYNDAYQLFGWIDDADRTITFTSAQTVPEEFYNWFIANASCVSSESGSDGLETCTVTFTSSAMPSSQLGIPGTSGGLWIKYTDKNQKLSNYVQGVEEVGITISFSLEVVKNTFIEVDARDIDNSPTKISSDKHDLIDFYSRFTNNAGDKYYYLPIVEDTKLHTDWQT